MTGYVWMRAVSIPRQWRDVTLEKGVSLDNGVVLLCSGPEKVNKILIRYGTYVNRFTIFDASEMIEVSQNCMIGPHCYITDHDHAHASGMLLREQPLSGNPVHIGQDVWIGAGAIILKGVTIGDHAVIGAGAVVTKDVPAGVKVAGVPAQFLRARN
jgi:acetyltransferase-like isoleucine patch superfamily enzyme